MTRARAASERFIAGLPPEVLEQLTPVFSPLIEICPLDVVLDLSTVRGLVFTSANAVAIAGDLIQTRDLACYCVGAATTDAARDAGWPTTQSGDTAQQLISTLTREKPDAPLLHLRGVHARGEIAKNLSRAGTSCDEQAIYDQSLQPLTDAAVQVLAGSDPVVAPLFSPRTARQFAETARIRAPLWLTALSPAVAEPLETLTFQNLLIADRPDSAAMRKIVELSVKRVNRVEGRTDAH
ncbi:uroporphyrinogen-III synthase [Ruegeria sp. 2205SS24-7]|uniref:uroporphyrinogen-III synthase n=1 Tax=Ruegeria discodermiae TaxID=3064389 RepID=UPI002740A95B|nr:uroporphyrinogen-III synthase [Ruegeria sp. 2205SS24-7]MDP5219910.1 uroporphyrinogen-III synthase [Ruegeria sp. 2205SS24-7]